MNNLEKVYVKWLEIFEILTTFIIYQVFNNIFMLFKSQFIKTDMDITSLSLLLYNFLLHVTFQMSLYVSDNKKMQQIVAKYQEGYNERVFP